MEGSTPLLAPMMVWNQIVGLNEMQVTKLVKSVYSDAEPVFVANIGNEDQCVLQLPCALECSVDLTDPVIQFHDDIFVWILRERLADKVGGELSLWAPRVAK